MFDNPAVLLSLGLLAFSSLPTTNAALSWSICTKDEEGKQVCKDRVPRGARIAIAIICLLVLVSLLTLVVCIMRRRRASAASEKEYNVEASQVDGPPTIIATQYNPNSGPSPVYSGRKSGYMTGNVDGRMSPQPPMGGPMYPATAHHYNNNPIISVKLIPPLFRRPPSRMHIHSQATLLTWVLLHPKLPL